MALRRSSQWPSYGKVSFVSFRHQPLNHYPPLERKMQQLGFSDPTKPSLTFKAHEYEKALREVQKTHDDKHPLTLNIATTLFYIHTAMYNLKEGSRYFQMVVSGRSKLQMPDDIATLELYRTYGLLNHYFDNLDAAKEYLEKAWQGYQTVLTSFSMLRLELAHSLGRLYHDLGNLDLAKDMYTIAMTRLRYLMDQRELFTMLVTYDYGVLLWLQSQWDDAELLLDCVAKGAAATLPANHWLAFSTAHSLGCFYADLGKWTEAEKWLDAAFEGKSAVRGGTPGLSIDTLKELGVVMYAQGRLKNSDALVNEALRRQMEFKLVEDVKLLLDTLNVQGMIYTALHKYSEATALLERAIHNSRTTYGEVDDFTISILSSLAILQRDKGNLSWAKEIFLNQLERIQFRESDNRFVAAYFAEELGKIYLRQRKFLDAKDVVLLALGIQEELHGDDHPTARELNLILKALENKPNKSMLCGVPGDFTPPTEPLKVVSRQEERSFAILPPSARKLDQSTAVASTSHPSTAQAATSDQKSALPTSTTLSETKGLPAVQHFSEVMAPASGMVGDGSTNPPISPMDDLTSSPLGHKLASSSPTSPGPGDQILSSPPSYKEDVAHTASMAPQKAGSEIGSKDDPSPAFNGKVDQPAGFEDGPRHDTTPAQDDKADQLASSEPGTEHDFSLSEASGQADQLLGFETGAKDNPMPELHGKTTQPAGSEPGTKHDSTQPVSNVKVDQPVEFKASSIHDLTQASSNGEPTQITPQEKSPKPGPEHDPTPAASDIKLDQPTNSETGPEPSSTSPEPDDKPTQPATTGFTSSNPTTERSGKVRFISEEQALPDGESNPNKRRKLIRVDFPV
ncbi:TPR-like protein [Piedraia hortae CBS 480.64]|uniref:TPR-like protein n=1 Tax=Piedraia hortae CBS 480.64 TaxID=1314780 RepID=A0A6A7C909_9PEZI|nr:TPR-like protein [Piedraia hortae CBS 480.64]